MFNKQSVFLYLDMVVSHCANAVKNWEEKIFEDDEKLSKKIHELTNDVAVSIPSFDFAKRKGTRRKESEDGRDGRTYTRDVVDVSIPFSGDAVAFDIDPSTKTLGARGIVSGSSLIMSFGDDERLEQNLDSMVKLIEGNLQHLARDLASLPARIGAAVDAVVAERKAQIARKRELDSKRSFPIE